jgi:hypothetical protein
MLALITIILVAIFIVDVVVGAFYNIMFLGDTQEMLVLLAAAICFSIIILRAESDKE